MDEVEKYVELVKKFSSFTEGTAVVPHVDFSNVNDFAKKLISDAEYNDFLLYSCYGTDPRIVILGITHTKDGRKEDQQEQLIEILKNNMRFGDVMLCEGAYGEVIYNAHGNRELVEKLKSFFWANDIRTIMNDSRILKGHHMIASSQLKKVKEKHGSDFNNDEVIRVIKNYVRAFKERDDNFCTHESAGIIHLVRNDAEIYKKPSPNATFYQVIGLLHVYADNIGKILRESDLDHLVFVPKKYLPLRPAQS